MIRLALIVNSPDWQSAALLDACREHGADPVPIRLADCVFDTAAPFGLRLPGFEGLPDAVLVRAVGGGTFEEVTRRLGVLHALSALNVPVWNNATAIERCVDKSMTAFLLARAGVPTPASMTLEGIEAAQRAVQTSPGPLVLKPLFGSQGRGLRLVQGVDDLPPPEEVAGIYHLQCFAAVPEGGFFRDYRLLVCAGIVIASMTRRSEHWITNVGRGGTPEPFNPGCANVRLAVRAAQAVGAVYAGVDLLRDSSGMIQVIEVNSMPGWRGLQSRHDNADRTPPDRRAARTAMKLARRVHRCVRAGDMRAEAGECARARGRAPDDGGGFPAQRARGCCAIVRTWDAAGRARPRRGQGYACGGGSEHQSRHSSARGTAHHGGRSR